MSTPTTQQLWGIHIPGPGDVLAAPSKAAAEHMAAKHNESMTSYLEAHPELLDRWGVTLESIKAQVIEWPHGADEHADELADFDGAQWGLIDAEQDAANALGHGKEGARDV